MYNNKYFKGGNKLVGQGSYGCVYKPGILCEGETELKKNEVSKLITNIEAQKELEQNKLFDRIDPDHLMHLRTNKVCKFKKSLNPALELDRCKVYEYEDKKDHHFSVIKLEDGGINLNNFLDNKKNISNENLLLGLSNFAFLFVGLNIMINNGVIHSDIKLDNVIINPKTLRLYYIDFGLSQELKNFTYHDIYFNYYPVFSPESIIFAFDHKTASQYDLQGYSKMIDKFLYDYKNYLKRIYDYYSETVETTTPIFMKYVKYLYYKNENYEKIKKEFFEKADIFALGQVFHKFFINYDYNYKKNPVQKLNISKKNMSELKSICKFLTLLMIRLDFEERINSEETILLYNLILIKITEISYEYNKEKKYDNTENIQNIKIFYKKIIDTFQNYKINYEGVNKKKILKFYNNNKEKFLSIFKEVGEIKTPKIEQPKEKLFSKKTEDIDSKRSKTPHSIEKIASVSSLKSTSTKRKTKKRKKTKYFCG
jgi:serine/threonine protein kinase